MANKDVTRQLSIFINDKQVVNSITGIGRAMRTTNNQILNLNRSSETYAEDLARLSAQSEELTQRQADLREELNGSISVFKQLSDALGPVATGMLTAFSVEAVVSSFVDGIKEAWHTVVDFNQKQADLAAIMGRSQTSIRNLTADAIKLGATTSYSASGVTELQTELARLGKTEPEIRKMTLAILNSATALESGLGEAAELVGGQLNSFQEDASQAQKYADIMANSVNISATSFESLSTALPKVSAVAYQSNISFEKLNAVLGTLADQNIAAETAGTGFRNILLTAAQAGVPYEQLLQKVKNSTNQLSTATEIFGKENSTVAVILANSTEKINENTKALENSGGAAEKLAKEKLNSLKGSLESLSGAWEGFILSIEKGDGALAAFARKTIEAATSILSLITPTQKLSDELKIEQLELNKLVSKITSSNISNEERKQLLIQLKQEYPDFIKNIDTETVSNTELKNALSSVNGEYIKRIALQKQQEKVDDKAKDQGYAIQRELEAREKLFTLLNELKVDNNLDVDIDYNKIEKSAAKVKKLLADKGLQYNAIDFFVGDINAMSVAAKSYQKTLDKEIGVLNRMSNALGIKTEAERASAAETKNTTKVVEKDVDTQALLLEKQIKDLTYTKNRREAMGLDTYNVQSQIFKLQQKLYKDDKDKYEEATNGLLKLQTERNKKSLEEQKKAAEAEKKLYDDRVKYFTKGNDEISALLKKAQEERELNQLTGAQREDAAITAKWDNEIAKYVDFEERKAELEDAKEKELADKRVERAKESAERIKELELQTEGDRLQRLFTNSMYLAEYEAQNQEARAVAAAEKAGATEAEIAAIKKQYAAKNNQTGIAALDFFISLKNSEVKWSDLTEKQKLAVTKQGLNIAAEMFNKGSGAWKALKIAETFIATKQAAITAYGALSAIPVIGPALGIAGAALVTAYGLKQVKEIANTKVDKAPKFFKGGYTGSTIIEPDEYGGITGATHKDEWVAPAIMTKNPRYANVIGWLEKERVRTGSGGSPAATVPNFNGGSNSPAVANNSDPDMKALMAAMLHRLENPIPSPVSIGYNEVKDIEKLKTEISGSEKFGKLNTL